MTLDEAIEHAEEVADEKKKEACNLYDVKNYEESRECIWCSEEHRQLAEWLKELKRYHQAKDGLLEDMKSLNCGFPFGLDYLISCIKKRLQEVEDENNITGRKV